MEPLNLPAVEEYVNENISVFHEGRLNSIQTLDMRRLLRKNPYLFRAKNILTASEMVEGFLDAFLSSSEEERFGRFLEGLAVFVAEQTSGGHKSTAEGVDLEFINKGVHYVVSVKSGPNWGNSDQQNRLENNLRTAVIRVQQGDMRANVRAVLGICYGRTRTNYLRGYLKVVGQNFWYFISEDMDLYTDIVEPIGYRAKEHNEQYEIKKAEAANRITKDFIDEYCQPSGAIDWPKLVKASCGNYDLDTFFSKSDD
ncbi:MAG: PmeII family type II restriction endonuclease [Dehalococcoidia bacterium]|nr:PmeII family type II restriction endonuclease [Dehalococcoidia bacterium]